MTLWYSFSRPQLLRSDLWYCFWWSYLYFVISSSYFAYRETIKTWNPSYNQIQLSYSAYAFKIFNLIPCSSVLTVRLKTLTEWALSTKLTLTHAIAFHNDFSLLCFFFSPPFGKQNNVSSSCLILRLKIENGLWIL